MNNRDQLKQLNELAGNSEPFIAIVMNDHDTVMEKCTFMHSSISASQLTRMLMTAMLKSELIAESVMAANNFYKSRLQ